MFGIQTALALNLQVKYDIVVLSFIGECTPYRPIGGPPPPSSSLSMKFSQKDRP